MMIHHGVCRSAAHGVVREVGCVTQKRQGFDFPAGLYRATTEMTFIRRCVLQVCCAGLIRRAFRISGMYIRQTGANIMSRARRIVVLDLPRTNVSEMKE